MAFKEIWKVVHQALGKRLSTALMFLHFRLATEEELRVAKENADRFEKENIELATQIVKKEQELEQSIQEKVQHNSKAYKNFFMNANSYWESAV